MLLVFRTEKKKLNILRSMSGHGDGVKAPRECKNCYYINKHLDGMLSFGKELQRCHTMGLAEGFSTHSKWFDSVEQRLE
jgi:hypothetical protein